MSEEQQKEEHKIFDDPKDAGGQATYKYYCKKCGRQWYDTWSSSSNCPKCGYSGTRIY